MPRFSNNDASRDIVKADLVDLASLCFDAEEGLGRYLFTFFIATLQEGSYVQIGMKKDKSAMAIYVKHEQRDTLALYASNGSEMLTQLGSFAADLADVYPKSAQVMRDLADAQKPPEVFQRAKTT